MNETKFLPNFSKDANLKSHLWNLFQQAEAEAKQFVQDASDWYEIIEIQDIPEGQRASWCWNDSQRTAVIKVAPKRDDLGVFFHEIFHSAFHHSLLHGKFGEAHEPQDDSWGEGFCEAFRYLMEKHLLPNTPSAWVIDMENLLKAPFSETRADTDSNYRGYRYPGSLILKAANLEYSRLKELWFELLNNKSNHIGSSTLNEHFNYDVQRGRLI
jgi:hypothetical protein